MAQDDLNRLLIEAQNYLGTQVQVPFQGQGDIAAGAGGLPGPPTGGPTGRAGQGAGGGVLGTAGGFSLPDLAKLFGPSTDLGTRGSTGGVSLSDQLRSLFGGGAGAGALGAPSGVTGSFGGVSGMLPAADAGTVGNLLGGAPNVPMTAEQLNSLMATLGPDASTQINEIVGGLEAATSGAQGGAGAGAGAGAAAGGAGGFLGPAATGAGALAAVLGALAQITGNPDLAKAATAAGYGTTGLGAAGAIQSAGAAPGVAGASSVGAGAEAAGGALPAVGGAATAALLPLAAASLVNLLDQGQAFNFSDIITGGRPDPYSTFASGLMGNEAQQGKAFSLLQAGLPYVQNQQELGQLINTYNNYLATTQNAPVESKGPAGPYTLSTIGGSGGLTHGQPTAAVDWGPATQSLQSTIDALKASLPGDPITALYGQPGGGLSGEPLMRLVEQFNPTAYAPIDVTQDIPATALAGGEGGFTEIPGLAAGFYAPGQLASRGDVPGALSYGQPGYDYAGAGGFPAPGQVLGTPSPQWLALTGQGGGTVGGAPASMDSITAAALSTPAGDFAGGMLPEEQRKRLLA